MGTAEAQAAATRHPRSEQILQYKKKEKRGGERERENGTDPKIARINLPRMRAHTSREKENEQKTALKTFLGEQCIFSTTNRNTSLNRGVRS